MKTEETAMKILNLVCKKGCAIKMYKELEKTDAGVMNGVEAMVEFFEPVGEEMWGIHFGAFMSYLSFVKFRQ